MRTSYRIHVIRRLMTSRARTDLSSHVQRDDARSTRCGKLLCATPCIGRGNITTPLTHVPRPTSDVTTIIPMSKTSRPSTSPLVLASPLPLARSFRSAPLHSLTLALASARIGEIAGSHVVGGPCVAAATAGAPAQHATRAQFIYPAFYAKRGGEERRARATPLRCINPGSLLDILILHCPFHAVCTPQHRLTACVPIAHRHACLHLR